MMENVLDLTIVDRMDVLDKTLSDILDKSNIFNKIVSRSAIDNKLLNVFDDEKLNKIAERMPEINRATRSLGRKNTQTTNKLMTLTMLSGGSPYRVIYQCLAQIEEKRNAIKTNRFRLMKERVEIQKLLHAYENIRDPYEKELVKINIQEKASSIQDTMLYFEGALKEIASFQSAYEQVCKNKDIPLDWDEEDLERSEIEHHVRMAFINAYRDIECGMKNPGTMEYLWQFGIHPSTAYKYIEEYLNNNESSDYDGFSDFLDSCVEKFGQEYKKALKFIGLDTLHDTWYMYKEESNGDKQDLLSE